MSMKNYTAALYLRSSKDRKDVSPDAQRRALLELAKARGLTVVEEFVDAVESGKDENRPGFQKLIKAVRNPARGWSTVLLHDTSRLSRRRVISLIFEEIDCKNNGVTVVYKTLPEVDPLTEIVLKSVMVAWDEYHSISSKQKGLAGMSENVQAGFRAGGRAPTGYVLRKIPTGAIREGEAVTKSVLEPDPSVADAMAIYLRDRAAGESRLRAKRKARLTDMKDSTLISIEWNALVYAGHTVWNVHAERQGGTYVGGTKRRPRSEWVIKRDTHTALITDEEAERILGRLERKAKARATEAAEQRDRDSSALLGGILFAPDGSKWWAETDRYRWERNGKARSISKASIDAQVIDQVLEDLASPGFAPALVHATRASLASDTDPAALRRISAEVTELATQISRAMDLAVQLSDPAPALRKVEELERKRAERAEQLQHLEAEAERAAWISKVGVTEVARMIAGIAADAKEAGRGELLRPVIISIVDRVEVDPQTLSGGICYRLATPESGVKLASPRGFEPRSLP
ncbi:recombinase family protein [Lysobacter cavernae]|uniref:Recombinase family protein n=1 Tax=Lysobacter cavernae TaxID=1685901 RepID=A0ABV7RJZ3_9GAMM